MRFGVARGWRTQTGAGIGASTFRHVRERRREPRSGRVRASRRVVNHGKAATREVARRAALTVRSARHSTGPKVGWWARRLGASGVHARRLAAGESACATACLFWRRVASARASSDARTGWRACECASRDDDQISRIKVSGSAWAASKLGAFERDARLPLAAARRPDEAAGCSGSGARFSALQYFRSQSQSSDSTSDSRNSTTSAPTASHDDKRDSSNQASGSRLEARSPQCSSAECMNEFSRNLGAAPAKLSRCSC